MMRRKDRELARAIEERDASRARAESVEQALRELGADIDKAVSKHAPFIDPGCVDPKFALPHGVQFSCAVCKSAWPCRGYIELAPLAADVDLQVGLPPMRYDFDLGDIDGQDVQSDLSSHLREQAKRHFPHISKYDANPGNFLFHKRIKTHCDECRRPWPCKEYMTYSLASMGITDDIEQPEQFVYDARVGHTVEDGS